MALSMMIFLISVIIGVVDGLSSSRSLISELLERRGIDDTWSVTRVLGGGFCNEVVEIETTSERLVAKVYSDASNSAEIKFEFLSSAT